MAQRSIAQGSAKSGPTYESNGIRLARSIRAAVSKSVPLTNPTRADRPPRNRPTLSAIVDLAGDLSRPPGHTPNWRTFELSLDNSQASADDFGFSTQ